MKILKQLFLVTLVVVFATPVFAQDSTTLVVRAQAKDAKFIGTSMGGALIRVINTDTGELMAGGLTEGSTGNTERLVTSAKERYSKLHTEGAAKFETTLELTEPVFVTIEALAPYAQKQAQVVSSTQMWLIPGKHITGDGIILEIPGFAVDVLEPKTHSRITDKEIDVRANIIMMCGCPTSDGGTWDSSGYDIEASIKRNGQIVDTIPMEYTGTVNLFSGKFQASESGVYEIIVYAFDPKTGNTGVDKTTVVVE